VAIVDLFPTLARIAGGSVPADRPIDGVDQFDFFMGRRETSSREHVLLFLGQKLMAIKWRNYKIHLDGLDRVDGVIEDWSFPRAFNLAADPKERWNILWQNSWLGERVGPFVAAYQASVKKYPNLAAGQADDQPPRYGAEDPAAETGAEGVQRKLESIQQH
jgi:arylsulfatase A-like enzyme